MKIRLIAIAAIALSPAVVLGQTRTHIRVSKDGTHSTTTQQSTNGEVYTAPTPAAQPTPAPDTAMAPTTPPADTTAAKTDSTQLGTGAAAPTPTHSMQTDSATTPMSDSSTMRIDTTTSTTTTAAPVDTVRVPRSPIQVSPVDSAKIGIPSTPEMQQRADSLRRAADTTTPPPR
ncbi:MAG TPA: hypothetical protein VIC55_09565 [Gemmatimonadaceae bacterium]|jgi:hypothetical protein